MAGVAPALMSSPARCCRCSAAPADPPGAMSSHKDIPGLTVQRYQEIIDGVVGKVRADFNQEGVDE